MLEYDDSKISRKSELSSNSKIKFLSKDDYPGGSSYAEQNGQTQLWQNIEQCKDLRQGCRIFETGSQAA